MKRKLIEFSPHSGFNRMFCKKLLKFGFRNTIRFAEKASLKFFIFNVTSDSLFATFQKGGDFSESQKFFFHFLPQCRDNRNICLLNRSVKPYFEFNPKNLDLYQ